MRVRLFSGNDLVVRLFFALRRNAMFVAANVNDRNCVPSGRHVKFRAVDLDQPITLVSMHYINALLPILCYSLGMQNSKAEIFNIDTSKDQQRAEEMRMTSAERLILCLDLMDLAAALSREKPLPAQDDDIEWIELKWNLPASESESV